MGGTDMDAIKHIRSITDKELIAAGGISSIEEIIELDKIGAGCQLGMGIYTGKIDLEEAYASLLDFEKGKGLIPTIVQDKHSKEVLMLAYSNETSLKKALKTGKATYYSRSRKSLWTKGETSGNSQKLVKVKYDCDKDSLLFIVEQTGPACHTGSTTCFGERNFDLDELYKVLESRFKELPEDSFTTKLFKDELFLKRKINEEAFEVVHAANKDELIWEVSDLTYFVMTLMVKYGVTLEDVKKPPFFQKKIGIHYMKILKYGEITKDFYKYHDFEGIESVSSIISDVKINGDKAVKEYSRKFGDGDLTSLEVTPEEIETAYKNTPEEIKNALKQAIENIKRFAKAQLSVIKDIETNTDGIKLGIKLFR